MGRLSMFEERKKPEMIQFGPRSSLGIGMPQMLTAKGQRSNCDRVPLDAEHVNQTTKSSFLRTERKRKTFFLLF
jgi:hypothetical protein